MHIQKDELFCMFGPLLLGIAIFAESDTKCDDWEFTKVLHLHSSHFTFISSSLPLSYKGETKNRQFIDGLKRAEMATAMCRQSESYYYFHE